MEIPKIEIQCSGSKQEIYSKIKAKLEYYQREKKLQIQDVSFNDGACEASAKGTGFKAQVKCDDGKVSVHLELGLLLRPLRAKIEQEIESAFRRALS